MMWCFVWPLGTLPQMCSSSLAILIALNISVLVSSGSGLCTGGFWGVEFSGNFLPRPGARPEARWLDQILQGSFPPFHLLLLSLSLSSSFFGYPLLLVPRAGRVRPGHRAVMPGLEKSDEGCHGNGLSPV